MRNIDRYLVFYKKTFERNNRNLNNSEEMNFMECFFIPFYLSSKLFDNSKLNELLKNKYDAINGDDANAESHMYKRYIDKLSLLPNIEIK